MGTIQDRAQRIIKADKAYRTEEVKYALSVMRGMPQEQLIEELQRLNLPELKAIVSCGVPGHAQNEALRLLAEKKRALEVIIENNGIEAVMQTETEIEEGSDETGAEGVRPSKQEGKTDS